MADAAGSPASSQISEEEQEVVSGRLLDGFLLLAAGGSPAPEDAITANLSSLNLVDVAVEDLAYFVNLDRLDASDNQLSYEQIAAQMGRLPRLVSLNLACNSISSLQVPVGTLRKLQTLDLSFNELHGDVLIQLAHLPGLVTLNLSRNCISSVPPEEDLYGLVALEELILDSNDLVQFIQWRALDALPRLRKLSLASNRVKRLKDDAPDTALGSEKLMYFPQLEELNLSNNEVSSISALPVLQAFHSLRILNLADNPCARGNKGGTRLGSTMVVCERTKPWYLQGNGCHQAKPKKKEPQLKMDRGVMRKVKSSPQVGPVPSGQRLRRGPSQIAALDAEANQLLMSLGSAPRNAIESAPAHGGSLIAAGYANSGLLGDEMSEEELRTIFRERCENIERKFASAETSTPESFMRPVPFEITSTAGQKLLMRGGVARQEEDSGGSGTRPTSETAFLTSIQEDTTDGCPSRDLAGPGDAKHVEGRAPLGSRLNLLTSASGGSAGAYSAGVAGASVMTQVDCNSSQGSATPHGVTLPPLRSGGSAVSSATGIGATSASADFAELLPPPMGPPGAAALSGGKRQAPPPSVHEAMRALRAAAKDYG